MDALSLTQPWASLMGLDKKRIETRDWRMPSRVLGKMLAIHASKGFPKDCRELVNDEPFLTALGRIGYHELPVGAIVGFGIPVECKRTEDWLGAISEVEEAFGNYGPERFGTRFENLFLLPKPIPAVGALGIWRIEETRNPGVEEQIISHLERL